MLGPDGGQRSQSTGSLDVTDNTDDNHRWGLDNGNGLDDFSLVHLGSRSVKVSDDVSHTGLVTHAGSKVDGLLGVILRESALFFVFLLSSSSPSIADFLHPTPSYDLLWILVLQEAVLHFHLTLPPTPPSINSTYLGESLNSTPVSGGTLPGNYHTVSTISTSLELSNVRKASDPDRGSSYFRWDIVVYKRKLEGQETLF